ncbi:glycosyl transferase, group 2 family [marine gamma proteobacterium HTCC2148]|nr:glycosyl transferase, group 2 family [marine gamma proteobacterium HTCC2148]
MNPPICIVMATCNGAPFIKEQIESIQAQSMEHWRLIIRDDGSTDATLDVLSDIADSDPRITILDAGPHIGLGPSLNFSAVLEAALKTESNLFFIADQDDVWDKEKLSLQAAQFPKCGAEDLPLLVHSDLAVVDEQLSPIHASLIAYMDLVPAPERPLNYLLTRNFVTGCATACNRQLLQASLPISGSAIMHDWWLALTAAANGAVEYLDQPLVKYRQHHTNSIGAKGFWHGLNPTNNWVAGWKAGNIEYRATFEQVQALAEHAKQCNKWPMNSIEKLERYLALPKLPRWKRLKEAQKMGIRQGNGLLQMIFYIRLLTVHHNEPSCPS